MRLMSAAPRDVVANRRSITTMFGRCRVIASSARRASASENETAPARSSRSCAWTQIPQGRVRHERLTRPHHRA